MDASIYKYMNVDMPCIAFNKSPVWQVPCLGASIPRSEVQSLAAKSEAWTGCYREGVSTS
ncbi:unnamed protein product [Prunus armeniaca]|uniref:Uncharacterized protein n=1 Tax=Prunus armeniaca TaxID=36596 RepID=A0A6J5VGT9_PRUAR|nr:unnamed protein product [Prunus armeniaca]